MASVSITNQTLTMTITIDGVDTVIRKDNCKVQAFGDVVRITDYKGSIYEFLYSDCTAPDEPTANDLRDAIEDFLNTGGGGGGGGITTLTSTDGSIDIDLTDPNAPDLSVGYRSYIGLINQSDTDAPVLTQQKNNTGITFTTEYISVGEYRILFSSYPTAAKVNVSIMSSFGKTNTGAVYTESVGIDIECFNALDSSLEDNNLFNARIEIQIFP